VNEFLLILGMGMVTFAIRYPVLALVGKIPLPERVFEALRYVPPAVLAAIIMPSLLMPDGSTLAIHPQNTRLLAGLLAAGVAWKTRNLLLTTVLGMAALLALNWLTGIH
jgi:branched-subunit amino acid transport protein